MDILRKEPILNDENPDIVQRSLGTHDGSFHADEVTSCALLIVYGLIDQDKIIRSRTPSDLASCEYVCDVGNRYDQKLKRFDHHQNDYTGSLSSAGMVLRYLHEKKIVSEGEFHLLASTLVDGVDAHDNGVDPQLPGVTTFSHIIANFAPIEYGATSEEQNICFHEALQFVIGHLDRLIRRYRYTQSMREIVSEAMKNQNDLLVFEQALPWLDTFFELGGTTHKAKFIIMPAGNHWKLRGIPPSLQQKMQVRIPLPLEWAGLQNEELVRISGIKGAIFCHKARFISVWKSKEDAIQAAEYILKRE